MAERKYYWIKLKRDFFKRHDIQIIEAMPNGKDYVLFYLKLLLESVDHDGALRFSDTIPYNEQMLSTITNTNIDVVRAAMKMFTELNMVEILDDKTIYMSEIDKMVGSETEWARKKRLYRAKEDVVLLPSSPCPTNVRQEIEIDKEIDIDNISSSEVASAPADKEKASFEKDSKPYQCALYLARQIAERIPGKKYAETTLQSWAKDFDRVNRLDGHSWDNIGTVLTFSQADSFWQGNILSGAKFRKQYDQLYLKMQKEDA